MEAADFFFKILMSFIQSILYKISKIFYELEERKCWRTNNLGLPLVGDLMDGRWAANVFTTTNLRNVAAKMFSASANAPQTRTKAISLAGQFIFL
jgi:hypothetical protein